MASTRSRKYRANLNLNKNQLCQAVIENRATPETTAAEGQVYHDTRNSDNRGIWVWLVNAWRQLIHTHWNGNISGLFNFVRTGAPFTVTSNTKVDNLNADMLDGYDTSMGTIGETIPVRVATGQLVGTSPTGTNHLATKEYVDAQSSTGGSNRKEAVKIATVASSSDQVRFPLVTTGAARNELYTANTITIEWTHNTAQEASDFRTNRAPMIDGVALNPGDRVLFLQEGTSPQDTDINQSSGPAHVRNGIYTFAWDDTAPLQTDAVFTRADDFDDAADLINGAQVFVSEGDIHGLTVWLTAAQSGWVPGTGTIRWIQVGGGNLYRGQAPIEVDGDLIRLLFDSGIFRIVNEQLTLVENLDARATFSNVVGKYTEDIGDGVSKDIPINHALNTRDVVVSVTERNTGESVFPDWHVVDANSIELEFGVDAPMGSELRVVVIG